MKLKIPRPETYSNLVRIEEPFLFYFFRKRVLKFFIYTRYFFRMEKINQELLEKTKITGIFRIKDFLKLGPGDNRVKNIV